MAALLRLCMISFIAICCNAFEHVCMPLLICAALNGTSMSACMHADDIPYSVRSLVHFQLRAWLKYVTCFCSCFVLRLDPGRQCLRACEHAEKNLTAYVARTYVCTYVLYTRYVYVTVINRKQGHARQKAMHVARAASAPYLQLYVQRILYVDCNKCTILVMRAM